MANASVRSAVARIARLDYGSLSEFRVVRIPQDDQDEVLRVLAEMKKEEEERKKNQPSTSASTSTAAPSLPADTPSTSSIDPQMAQFDSGAPLKRVKIPEADQEKVQKAIDEMKANL